MLKWWNGGRDISVMYVYILSEGNAKVKCTWLTSPGKPLSLLDKMIQGYKIGKGAH
jgi:hypothetical protein